MDSEEERKYLENFEGVMIDVSDRPLLNLDYRVPGWRCIHCGWTVGAAGLPPQHKCPEEGIQQRCSHEWGADTDYTLRKPEKRPIVYRECVKCEKREYRFKDGRWLD